MTHEDRHRESIDAWDNRELGASEEYVKVATEVDETAIDRALELHPISIRLQKSLIEDLKHIARLHGLGYQPLMRQVLSRFVECEKKRVLRERGDQMQEEESGSDQDSYNTAVG